MSEKEKEILTNLGRALPNMSEFDKGYLLGIAEAKAGEKRERDKNADQEKELVQQ